MTKDEKYSDALKTGHYGTVEMKEDNNITYYFPLTEREKFFLTPYPAPQLINPRKYDQYISSQK